MIEFISINNVPFTFKSKENRIKLLSVISKLNEITNDNALKINVNLREMQSIRSWISRNDRGCFSCIYKDGYLFIVKRR